MRGYLRRLAGLATAGLLLTGPLGPTAQAAPTAPKAAQDVSRGNAIATTSWKTGRFDVYRIHYENNTNAVQMRTFDGARWHPWYTLDGRFHGGATVSALSRKYGRIDIFLATKANPNDVRYTLFHRYFEGRWSGWEQLGTGYLDAAPYVVSPAPDRLDLVARKPGGEISHRSFTEARGWGPWENLGVRSWGGPVPNSRSAATGVDMIHGDSEIGIYHVYGTDGAWQYRRIEEGSSGANTYAGTAGLTVVPFPNEPARMLAYSWYHNLQPLYVNLYNGYWRGSRLVPDSEVLRWHTPITSTFWDRRTDLFGQGDDGTLYHYTLDLTGAGSDQTWRSLGGPRPVNYPTVTSWAPGHIEVFVTDQNNVLHHRSFVNGAWRAWEAL